jgi:hypothetical protein
MRENPQSVSGEIRFLSVSNRLFLASYSHYILQLENDCIVGFGVRGFSDQVIYTEYLSHDRYKFSHIPSPNRVGVLNLLYHRLQNRISFEVSSYSLFTSPDCCGW